MELSFNEKKLLSLLKNGEGNATPGKELGAHFNADDSFIRALVNSLRRKGIPICSSASGYYFGSDDEKRATGRRERARIAKQQAAAAVFLPYEKPLEASQRQGKTDN